MGQIVNLLIIGMAGSGKTTFSNRLFSHLTSRLETPFVVNLDPAVLDVPYPPDIDIRDTIDCKSIMKEFGLGPNGAIVTSLNLFSSRIDELLVSLSEAQGSGIKHSIIDTPGQIEVFTWSASGTIITETLAALYPTVVVYIIDTVRCISPKTFMSNMLYACSILYKTRLPFIIVFNKIDQTDYAVIKTWMTDYESFQEALEKDTTFASSLTNSMSLLLEEFYSHIKTVGVSSTTGENIDKFVNEIGSLIKDYKVNYKPIRKNEGNSAGVDTPESLADVLKTVSINKV